MGEIAPARLPVVAIDGPAAAGKSTVAHAVAAALGIGFFDTGLLYRAAALLALRNGVSPSDSSGLVRIVTDTAFDVSAGGVLLVDGESVSHLLRRPEVELIVSEVSAHPEVRRTLFQVQRRIAEAAPVVMVGRDITTVVVPDAAVRIYLDASAEERARRRFLERQDAFPTVDYDTILADLTERDRKDSSREAAPLHTADGVTVVSSDGKSVEAVTAEILSLVEESFPLPPAAGEARQGGRPPVGPPPEFEEGSCRYSTRRKIVQAANGWWIDLLSNLEIEGEENIPPWGPLLYVSNHLHNLDPVIEYKAFPRPIHYMGKQELFRLPVIKKIAEWSGGFPVDRGKFDREALRNAENRVERGIPLGIYPEGGRSPTGALIEGKPGAGMLALKTGAPILPVAITGSERLPLNGGKGKSQRQVRKSNTPHRHVRLVYGEPFTVPRNFDGEKISSDEATETIMLEIARLLPEEYQGVYAERLAAQTVRKIVSYSFSDSDVSSPDSSDSSSSGVP